jgi:hypothetical protein
MIKSILLLLPFFLLPTTFGQDGNITDLNGVDTITGNLPQITIIDGDVVYAGSDLDVFTLMGAATAYEDPGSLFYLSDSKTGVNYVLYKGAVAQDTVAGDGDSISFGYIDSSGVYSCLAYKNSIQTWQDDTITLSVHYWGTRSKALFARMSPIPIDARKGYIEEFYDSIDYYYSGLVYHLYFMAADVAGNAYLDWYGVSNLTLVSTPTFTADQGFTGNGLYVGLNTNYNPSTDANYKQDTCSHHVYSRTNNFDNKLLFGCSSGGNRIELTMATTGPVIRGRLHLTTTYTIESTSNYCTGLLSLRRVGATQYLYRNGIELKHEDDASTGIPNETIKLLYASSIGTGSTNQISFYCVGKIVNPLKLSQAVERYLDHLGTGVIASLDKTIDYNGTLNFAEYLKY